MLSHLSFNCDHFPEVSKAKTLWEGSDSPAMTDPALFREDGLHYMSGSRWTEQHQHAFHFVVMRDVKMECVIPEEFLPSDNDPDFEFFAPWWLINIEELINNPNADPRTLSGIKPRQVMLLCPVLDGLCQLVTQQSDSESEGEGKEKPPKCDPQHFAWKLIVNMLMGMRMAGPSGVSYELVLGKHANGTFFRLDNLCSAENFGAICWNPNGEKKKRPLLWFEVKPNAISEKDEHTPQKIAITIALAYNFDKISQKKGGCMLDQEVFGISFDNRWVRFWHALVPGTYIHHVQTYDTLPPEDFVILKHTKSIDLAETDGRKQFITALWGVMHYLRDGKAKIGKWE